MTRWSHRFSLSCSIPRACPTFAQALGPCITSQPLLALFGCFLDEALWCERVAVEGGGLDESDDVLWE